MAFRQDTDPGSVKSLLALLRSNQTHTHTPSPSATPPPFNPFSSAPPQSNPIVPPASSLQDLLETLRRANDSPLPTLPQPGPSSGAGYRDDGGRDVPRNVKRRRIEPSSIDPYAEDLEQYDQPSDAGAEEEEEELEQDTSDLVHRPEDVREASARDIPRKSQPENDEPPDSSPKEVGTKDPAEDGGVEEDEDDDRNRYGYTPEQMSTLPFDQGRPIIIELLERADILSKLKQVRPTLSLHPGFLAC